jgi:hypothetical protein
MVTSHIAQNATAYRETLLLPAGAAIQGLELHAQRRDRAMSHFKQAAQ